MPFKNSNFSGRVFLFCALLASWLAFPAFAAQPGKVLRVLSWPGYADADIVRQFEQAHGVRVELTEITSDANLWQRVNRNDGGDFDIFAVNTAELQRYIDRELVHPINPEQIPNTRRQLPRFQKLKAIPGLMRHGHVYGIPYTYAEMGLIYDRTQFSSPPTSIAALWDPGLRGKVLAYNGGSHNFSLAALALGQASPFRIDDKEWRPVVDKLIALRRNVLGFYSQPDEATELFLKHRVALLFANYGMQQVQSLRAAGADIGYVIPRQGTLAWLDCWVITRGAQDLALAHAWINHMLESEASARLVSIQGLANTLKVSTGSQTDDRLLWLEPVENVDQREAMWRKIHSGDHLERILTP